MRIILTTESSFKKGKTEGRSGEDGPSAVPFIDFLKAFFFLNIRREDLEPRSSNYLVRIRCLAV